MASAQETIGPVSLMRILILAPFFPPAVRAGGPVISLTNLVAQLERDGLVVDVVARDRDHRSAVPFPGLSGRTVRSGSVTVYYLDAHSPRQVSSLLRKLRVISYDLIMVNSIWDVWYSFAPTILASLRCLKGPVLLLPRGELEEGALAIKARKKNLARGVVSRVYAQGISVFGATSEREAENIASWFPSRPVLTSHNNLPETIRWGKPTVPNAHLRVVFLSRINRKKGLLELLRSLGTTSRQMELQIVGPGEDATYWHECKKVSKQLPPNVRVTQYGLASREEVPGLLWNADCMAFLTAGENYGHVIAESLQAGCPVITTPTTPWTDVLRAGGGEIVENRDDAQAVGQVLDRWAARTPEELLQARHKARAAFEEFAAQAGPNIVTLALEHLGKRRA